MTPARRSLLASAHPSHTLAIVTGPDLSRGEARQFADARALEAAGLVTLTRAGLPGAVALKLTDAGTKHAQVYAQRQRLLFSPVVLNW